MMQKHHQQSPEQQLLWKKVPPVLWQSMTLNVTEYLTGHPRKTRHCRDGCEENLTQSQAHPVQSPPFSPYSVQDAQALQ